ncbi:MAG: plasmid pRiA4b ORF-3 family protein [Planctomycetales bacterium]|nr:plasmid pRiA4b ORF-3 family protein [Planctomycetales bacterium]
MDDKITIPLSASQRNLLLKYETDFENPDLFRLVAVASPKGKHYEILLDEEQLEDLLDQISELSDNEENEKMQDKLEKLCDDLSGYSSEFGDGEPEYSDYSCNTGAVYTLKVALESAPGIWRKIAIRAGQTLHDLHSIVFEAFDRDDEHLYSFYIPTHPLKSRPRRIYDVSVEYTHPFNLEEQEFGGRQHHNAAMTTIETLKLTEKQQFYYLFDFGDSWWHTITVEGTQGKADNREYPRILERKSESPPQYGEPEEEDDYDEYD